MNNAMKMFVPHSHFGTSVTGNTWDDAKKNGLMATLPFAAFVRFGWISLCGWSMIDHGSDGVLFVKEVSVDSE